jgi:penicillin G amidase
MKWIKAILPLALALALFFVGNTKFGGIPPLGKLLSPFTGFWQNADPRQLEAQEELQLQGLQGQVSIVYDTNRVPHIFAGNDHDLYFAQGFVTARDRLWQMDFQTLAAAGRLAEVVGAQALDFDRFQRRIGMVYGARQSLAAMMADPVIRNTLQAYTAGVNAYIQSLSPKDYPLEYKLLDYAPEAWSPLKCALLLKMMAYNLTARNDDLRMSNILRQYGPEVVADLFPDYPSREDPIVPPGTRPDFTPLPTPATPAGFLAAFTHQQVEREPPEGLGSNNWAVAGSKSATGYPLLANDPHLQLSLPSLWYQVQLVGPDVNVAGVSLPGAPGVIIGFNQQVSWGVTNVHADVLDWYQLRFRDGRQREYWHDKQWKPVRPVVELIKVRGGDLIRDTVYYTHHGPIVYRKPGKVYNPQTPVGHAMRWIAHEKFNELKTFYLLNRARHYQDYRQALTYYGAPAQNFIYADVHQDIALWVNGRFPLKWKNQGKFILDGTNPAYDWQGWIPPAHNPHVKNPARGFVSSANQFPTGPDYPYYLNWQFESPERGMRINQRLAAMQQVTVDSLRALQNDNFNLHAQTILPLMLGQVQNRLLDNNQRQAFQELSDWDYRNEAPAIGATLFEVWWPLLEKAIWQDELGSSDSLPRRYPSRDRTVRLLQQQPQAQWFDNVHTPDKETRTMLVQQSFTSTVDSLVRQHGPFGPAWAWARHKGTSLQHLARVPAFGKEHLRIGGGRHIVNATADRQGPSWRMVVALGPQVKAYGVYPGGQSGNPGSFYYDNLVETWRQGKLNELLYMQSVQDPAAAGLARLTLHQREKLMLPGQLSIFKKSAMRLFILVLVLGFVLQLFLPWWISGLVSFVLAFLWAQGPGQAFAAGFGGIGLGWLLYSLFFHLRNEGILAPKMGTLLQLPHPLLLLLLGAIVGGLAAGTAALAGLYCRRLV